MNNPQVNYHSSTAVGPLKFPAPWVSKEELKSHIEMIMHQLFLGVTESNFALCDKWMKQNGLGVNTFRRDTQRLLKDIQRLQLSWCLAQPFNGKNDNLLIGSWVSENWLAWTRLSKIVYGWCLKDGDASISKGSNDVARMVTSFVAMIARLMAHAGVDEESIHDLEDLYIKEFMSCIMEMDIDVNFIHIKPIEPGNKDRAEKAKSFPWWMKSNYLSLFNLPDMLRRYGPLVNLWDGGGKGEKFIIVIKPMIPRGIRNSPGFFCTVSEKVYKNDFMSRMQQISEKYRRDNADDSSHGSSSSSGCHDIYCTKYEQEDQLEEEELNDQATTVKIVGMEELSDGSNVDNDEISLDVTWGVDSTGAAESNDTENNVVWNDDADRIYGSDSDSGNGSSLFPGAITLEEKEYLDQDVDWQRQMMGKARTIYVYKTEAKFSADLQAGKALSGVIIQYGHEEVFMIAHRLHGKKVMWNELPFLDAGVSVNGAWYSPLGEPHHRELLGGTEITHDQLVRTAKMSAIAIPLEYIIGPGKPDSRKYCVITNWWKERVKGGAYKTPGLDRELWGSI
jgi:hypothetical protein